MERLTLFHSYLKGSHNLRINDDPWALGKGVIYLQWSSDSRSSGDVIPSCYDGDQVLYVVTPTNLG